METIAISPPPEGFVPPEQDVTEAADLVEASQADVFPEPATDFSPEEAAPADGSKFWQRARRWIIGEAGGNALEGAAILLNVPLPARVGADAAIDQWTYGSQEKGEPGSRRARLGIAAATLAVNMAASWALQKGVPVGLEAIDDNLNTTFFQTATQLMGKVGVMATAVPVIGRRFSRQ